MAALQFRWKGKAIPDEVTVRTEVLNTNPKTMEDDMSDLDMAIHLINGRFSWKRSEEDRKKLTKQFDIRFNEPSERSSAAKMELGYTDLDTRNTSQSLILQRDDEDWYIRARNQQQQFPDEANPYATVYMSTATDYHVIFSGWQTQGLLDVTFHTAKTALTEMINLQTGECDALQCPAPDESQETLHHWANVTCTFHDSSAKAGLTPVDKYRQFSAEAHHDLRWTGNVAWSNNHSNNDGVQSNSSSEWRRYCGKLPAGHPRGKEQSDDHCYLHKLPHGQGDILEEREAWYRLYRTKKSMVDHVRAELDILYPEDAQASLQWDALKIILPQVNNPLVVFALTDERNRRRKVLVVKGTSRGKEEPKNDNVGQNADPRELFLNRIVQRMGDENDDLVKMVHNSYHHSASTPYYLYFDYIKYGSLDFVLEDHRIRKKYIPEIFIWYVFLKLAGACDLLQSHPEAVRNGQNGYMHVDIRPANIFLGRENNAPGPYPMPDFPEPLLADLETYYRLGHENIVGSLGTEGWQAPEQIHVTPAEVNNGGRERCDKIDVWQIGLVIFCLMRKYNRGFCGDTWGQDDEVGADDVDKEKRNIDFRSEYDDLYSYRLTKLVDACMDQNQNSRPTLEQIKIVATEGIHAAYDKYRTLLGIPEDSPEEIERQRQELPEDWRLVYGDDTFTTQADRMLKRKWAYEVGPPDFDDYDEGDDEIITRVTRDSPPKSLRQIGHVGQGEQAAQVQPAGVQPVGVPSAGVPLVQVPSYRGGSWGEHEIGAWEPYPGGVRLKRRMDTRANGPRSRLTITFSYARTPDNKSVMTEPVYDPANAVITVRQFIQHLCHGHLLDMKRYAQPPPDIPQSFTVAVDTVVRSKNRRRRHEDQREVSTDNEEPDKYGVKKYFRYTYSEKTGDDDKTVMWYARTANNQWRMNIPDNAENPGADPNAEDEDEDEDDLEGLRVTHAANGHESTYERRKSEEFCCYRWPGDDITTHDGRTGEWKRYSLQTTQKAAKTLDAIVSGDLRLSEPDPALVDVNDAMAFGDWVKVTETMYVDGDTRFKILRVENDLEIIPTNMRLLFRKDGPAIPWTLATSAEMPKEDKKPVKTSIYRLKVGKPGDHQRLLGSMWLRRENEKGEPGTIFEIMGSEYSPVNWKQSTISHAINSTMGIGRGTWHFLRCLYNVREFKKIMLWGCVSPDNLLLDRVVAKRFPSPYSVTDTRNEKVEKDTKRELELHQILSNDIDAPIVLLRGWAQRRGERAPVDQRYIAYMEYAEGGDVSGIINAYSTATTMGKRHCDVPEMFLWLMFERMILACQKVESLGRIHPDIKPLNIFLRGRPSTGNYRGYVQPVLGDFGILDPIDKITGAGTIGFWAPELMRKHAQIGLGSDISGRKIHAFSIALCIWAVMRKESDGLGRDAKRLTDLYESESKPKGARRRTDSRANASPYSARLEKLLLWCMNENPEQRPTLEVLLKHVKAGIKKWERRRPGFREKVANELSEFDRIVHEGEREFLLEGTVDVARIKARIGEGDED
ncbi:kinase-like protein [Byssothecium circinans]|uniref:non-specific serine/threonine protein kinase n=1 Tax=Byssothecium circinans TaxID=147558 RepID=A0A6A5TPN4_9PLEO|nr:kinase-like protein [Byssothecium circinans]